MHQQPPAAPLDDGLANCAAEPIHIPGSIQPHGLLLAMHEPALTIAHASENAEKVFGLAAHQLIGRRLQEFVAPNYRQLLMEKLAAARLQSVNPIKLELVTRDLPRAYDAIAHRSQGLLIVELEPSLHAQDTSFSNIYQQIHMAVDEIGSAQDLAELFQITARRVKALSGYQRIMIYEFDPQWNGKVVAEACEPTQQPFLGLQYPASDIPEQARRLYLANWLRLIPNVDYAPSPIIPALVEHTKEPLILSGSVLRSVSPMHVQYLKNMGVGASMSVSIIKDGELWGLIAMHHQNAAYLPYEVRQGLEFIGKIFSIQLGAKLKSENSHRKAQLRDLQAELLRRMRAAPVFVDGLHRDEPTFLAMAEGATGGAIMHQGKISLYGVAPSCEQVASLVQWLNQQATAQPLFHTTSLANLGYPEAAKIQDVASGVLIITIPELLPMHVIWFKPEVLQTVNWGGNPEKAMELSEEGVKLGPRRSFALWQQEVRQRSLPWQDEDMEAIEMLRRSLIEVDLERQVRSAMESNAELDQFTSVVSHDLKEPLRGIGFYADFLQEDLPEILEGPSREHLLGIKQLADKARGLITELYEYSRIGRVELSFADVDIEQVVVSAHARLNSLFQRKGVTLRMATALPSVYCDRVRIAEVFVNLMSNAAKYSSNAQPIVEVGADTRSAAPAFYVRDNGIGIAAHAHERIFRMFARLNSEQQYDGGTGVGLAIAKRIVDRHGGQIWVESEPGQGSTFFFTLQPEQATHSKASEPVER